MLSNPAYNRYVIAFALAVVVLTITFGGVLSSQTMMQDGKMTNCPFMGISLLCKMDVSEHLSQWQRMFIATPQQFFGIALLLLSLFVLFLLTRFLSVFSLRNPRLSEESFYLQRVIEVFDPLKLAFARGLIHSKTF